MIEKFFLILLVLFAQAAYSQQDNKNFQAQVLERGTRRPLAGVSVFLLPDGLKQVTDKKGNFTFGPLEKPLNEFEEIIITASGYKRIKRDLMAGSPNIFYLERESYQTFETTVLGKLDRSEPAKTTLTQEEFLKAPGSNGDPVRAVENLPGVAQSLDANVAIQGSPPEDTRYLIEGHQIPFIFHFFGLNTVAVPETIKSVDFLSAGYGPEYGRAAGGIINLNLDDPRDDRFASMAFVDFTALGGLMEGPIDEDERFFVGGRYSYLGEVLKFGVEQASDEGEDGPPTFNSAPTYFDINLQYHKDLSDDWKLKFTGIASRDRAEAIVEQADDPTFAGRVFGQTQFFRLITGVEGRVDKDSNFKTSIASGLDHQTFEPGVSRLDDKKWQTTWLASYAKRWAPGLKTTIGTDILIQDYDIENQISSSFFNEEEEEVPEAVADDVIATIKGSDIRSSAYLRNDIDLIKDKLILSPNVRVSHFRLHGDTYVQPRFLMTYRASPSLNFYAQTGTYYQPAEVRNLDPGTGNPELEPQYALHHALRFDKDFRDGGQYGLKLQGGVFIKDVRDAFARSSRQVRRDGVLVPEVVNNERSGEIHGGEVLATLQYRRFGVNLGYTYTESVQQDASGLEFPSEQDQTHNLNLTGSYTWGNFTLATRLRWVTGIPYTPLSRGVYFENADVFIPRQGERLSERYPDFWQLDLRIDRKWIYDRMILSLYLDIQNVTNRQNVIVRNYNFDYSRSVEATGLPILPTFGIKGEF